MLDDSEFPRLAELTGLPVGKRKAFADEQRQETQAAGREGTAPLILRRFPAEPLCTIEIRCIDGEQVQRKPKEDPGRWDARKIVEWVHFDPKSGKFCQLFIRLSAFPKDTPVGAEGF